MKLRAGDWVEVRSKEQILRTLDKDGRLDSLPFMPQMFQYCGQRFRVYKRAHKTCDTISRTGGRRLANAVHLELRCDGKAFGGCQASCLLFWKQAWLKPCTETRQPGDSSGEVRLDDESSFSAEGCSEEDVWRATRVGDGANGETRYACQATRLLSFTTPLSPYSMGQYLEDYTSGNATVARMLRVLSYRCLRPFNWRFPAFRKVHDWLKELFGGIPFPTRIGTVRDGEVTPTATLNLQPGELVKIKSYSEILATLDSSNKNRGLLFDKELVPFCGRAYRVRTRVDRFIDEKTGKLREMKTPAVILENVSCQSCYSDSRFLCPRSIYAWWREIWLERVPETRSQSHSPAQGQ